MDNPSFTVIVTTYRRPEFLKQALASVLKQDFRDFECLVINDDPGDNSRIGAQIAELHDTRFQFIASQQNKGGNYCRNRGIHLARGKYIAFLDDDDIWFPGKLGLHFKRHQDTKAELVYSDYIRKAGRPNPKEIMVEGPEVPDDIPNAMFKGKFSIGTTSSVTLKRTSLPDPFFDEALVSFQDWDAWLSLALKQKEIIFSHIKKPLLFFVQHENDRTSRNVGKREKGFMQIVNKYGGKKKMKGFYYKELMNIKLLEAAVREDGNWRKRSFLLQEFVQCPGCWFRTYPVRRVVKYLILGR